MLLVTLIVRIAVVSLLAIMVVRYHRFRDLLIHERRGWPMKFFFAFSLRPAPDGGRGGAPAPPLQRSRHHAGGRVPGRTGHRPVGRGAGRGHAGHARDHRQGMGGPALRHRLRLRGRRHPGGLSQGSDLAFLAVRASATCTATSGGSSAASRSTGRSSCWRPRSALLLLQLAIGHRWPTRIYALDPDGPVPDGDGLSRDDSLHRRRRSRSGTTRASSTGSASRRSSS